MKMSVYIGVDVGTASVRAGLVDGHGNILAVSTKSIEVNNPIVGHYQQSSEEIWQAVVYTVREILSKQNVQMSQVAGIGFDATCSLVVIGHNGKGISVDQNSNSPYDVIMWMDHRAMEETQFINASKHGVLKYVGGEVSVEMQMPKLLWIKKNLPNVWRNVQYLFDLSDFLVWKATGCSDKRSLCSAICKWNFEVDESGTQLGWNKEFLNQIGLAELAQPDGMAKIGSSVVTPGSLVGNLSKLTLEQFGIDPNAKVKVGAAMIDAHAGSLGMLACTTARSICRPDRQLGLVSGTSTCHMALTTGPVFVPGVWGPYFSAVLPGYWLLEGGQTAVGSLLDHLIESHPSYEEAQRKAGTIPIQQYLERILEEMASPGGENPAFLTQNLHVYPDFHGNRSPLADPLLRGSICGLSLDKSITSLALLYLAGVQALSYGTRHIVEEMKKCGTEIEVVVICGGLSQSSLYTQTHADVLGLRILKPKQSDVVLLGASILGVVASKDKGNLPKCFEQCFAEMGQEADIYEPQNDPNLRAYHDKKYLVFREMCRDQQKYRSLMHNA